MLFESLVDVVKMVKMEMMVDMKTLSREQDISEILYTQSLF